MKLLLSAVDTMAFLAKGQAGSKYFKTWLDTYVDLSPAGVTSDELWEHRNALLHMTTLDSRKVKGGKILRLTPYKEPVPPIKTLLKGSKFYSIDKVWIAIGKGIDNFVKDIESNEKLAKSVESNWKKIVYDEPTISVKPQIFKGQEER